MRAVALRQIQSFTRRVLDPLLNVIGIPQSPTYDEEVWADSPHTYYRLNETTGTTARDSSGNQNTGTYAHAISAQNPLHLFSKQSQAFPYQGTNSHGISTPINIGGLTAFSIEIWLSGTTSAPGYIFTDAQDFLDEGSIRVYYGGDGKVGIRLDTGGTVNEVYTAAGIGDSTEHHVVITWDKNTDAQARIYVDGVLDATGPVHNFTLTHRRTLRIASRNIGSNSDPFEFEGQLDGFAFYTTALPAGRIQAHYDAGAVWQEDHREIADPRPLTGFDTAVAALTPYAHYKLDETSGTVATDSSGNARNGTYLDVARGVAAAHYGSDGAQTFIGNVENTGLNAGFSLSGFTGLTLAVWFNTTNTGVAQGFFYDVESGLNVGNVGFRVGPTGIVACALTDEGQGVSGHTGYNVSASSAIVDNANHFAVITWDGSTFSLYVDGVLVDSIATPATTLTCTQLLRIGGRNSDPGEDAYFPFTGRLDAAVVDNSAWTAAQIADLYLKGRDNDIVPYYDDEVVALTPYAHYPLDELEGTQADDVSGNARHGTYLEKVRPVDGMVYGDGFAQTFVDNNESSGINSGINVDGWNAISICAWVDRNDNSGGPLVTNDRDSDPTNAWGSVVYGRNRFSLRNAEASEQFVEFLPDAASAGTNRLFLVGTWDRNGDKKLRAYVNGVLVDESVAFDAALQITPRNLRIGAKATNSNTPSAWTGSLDAVSIFDRALTATEIQDLYVAGSNWPVQPV